MTEKNEFELIKEFLRGNEKAFNELVRIHQRTIYWHARRMLGNHLDADEVTQQVIITMYTKLKKFKFNSSLSTWLYKVTQSRSLNLIRRNKVKQLFSLNNSTVIQKKSDEDILTDYENKEKINKVQKLLDKLPVKQKQVFLLRHFEELSYEEISKITGKSVGGLKANYFHASKKIIEMMKNEN
jgi:RNA polymerase sigma-70 factor (ECF subfamily)